ncbi:MAG: hypothetical protein PHE86_07185, partial [Candidatus Marinimicrobia bacterium]|nr:hypothetical protein [Candidatus Neomarinimicrobiota bacterium]
TRQSIRRELETLLDNDIAFNKFLEIAEAQGGDISVLKNPDSYPKSAYVAEVTADEAGTITAIDTYGLGLDAIDLGAGRRKYTDTIDPKAGMLVYVSIGDKISSGDLVVTLFSDNEEAITIKAAEIGERFVLNHTL